MKRIKIMVASDLHVMAPELLQSRGEAFERVLNSDRKLLVESPHIISNLVRHALVESPDLLLIPGDLTKDGEYVSHQLLVELLAPLRAEGIPTLVVPGNHDLNNPLGRYYDGKDSRPARHTTPAEFRVLYSDHGYSGAHLVEEGPQLSYLAEPVLGLQVLALDSCIYEDNLREHYPRTGGRLGPEVLSWVRDVASRARQQHKRLIAMSHHGLLEHFPMQSLIARDYLVEEWIHTSEALAEAGVSIVFTGHFHAQDIAHRRFAIGELYEVETGSAVTYPCPYRIAYLSDDSMDIESYPIEMQMEEGMTLQTYAYRHLEAGLPGMAEFLIEYVQRHSPSYMSTEMAQYIRQGIPYFADLIMKVYTGHLQGDETGLDYNPDPSDADAHPGTGDKFQQLKRLISGIYPQYRRLIGVVENALYNTSMPDNHAHIPLPPLGEQQVMCYKNSIFAPTTPPDGRE